MYEYFFPIFFLMHDINHDVFLSFPSLPTCMFVTDNLLFPPKCIFCTNEPQQPQQSFYEDYKKPEISIEVTGFGGAAKAKEVIQKSREAYVKFVEEQEKMHPELQNPSFSSYKQFFG